MELVRQDVSEARKASSIRNIRREARSVSGKKQHGKRLDSRVFRTIQMQGSQRAAENQENTSVQ